MIKKSLSIFVTLSLLGFDAMGLHAADPVDAKRVLATYHPTNPAYVETRRAQVNQAEEVVVRFHDSVSLREKSSFLSRFTGGRLLKANQFGVFTPEGTIEEAIKESEAEPNVKYAEANVEIQMEAIPNDTLYDQLWGMDKIEMPDAWDITEGSDQIIVAVVDSGVNYSHPDLAANMWVNPNEIPGNGIDDDNNGFVDDVHGANFHQDYDTDDPMDDNSHGSHVAGTIGAVGNNDEGVIGVSPNVKIMALKFLNENGSGFISDAIEAIQYGMDHGAHIMNHSWRGIGIYQSLQDILTEAHQNGILNVAAAGNDAWDFPVSPGNLEDVFTVAASDQNDQLATFTNYGIQIDATAPGVEIHSTVLNDALYDDRSGTSMASPHVAGLAALMMAQHPTFSHEDIAGIIRWAVDPYADNLNRLAGRGRINARRALFETVPLPIAEISFENDIVEMGGDIPMMGRAFSDNFAHYEIHYGEGLYPQDWNQLLFTAIPVPNGTVGVFNGDQLPDGIYTIRMRVHDTFGRFTEIRRHITLNQLQLNSLRNNQIFRKGSTINVQGIIGFPFDEYRIEVGSGKNPSEWSDQGVTLTVEGPGEGMNGILGRINTNNLILPNENERNFYRIRLMVRIGETVQTLYINMIYIEEKMRRGFPRSVAFPSEDNSIFIDSHFRVADLDKNGTKEIIVLVPGHEAVANPDRYTDSRLVVFRQNGSTWWQKTGINFSDFEAANILIGNVDSDPEDEIIIDGGAISGTQNEIYGYNYNGVPIGGNWPLRVNAANIGMIMADVDRDHENEIIVQGYSTGTNYIYVLSGNGVIEHQFESPAAISTMQMSVGNFDRDAQLELVHLRGANELVVTKIDGTVLSGWPVPLETRAPDVNVSMAVGDVDGDGFDNVVVGAYENNMGSLKVFDRDGSLLPGWPVTAGAPVQDWISPALADFNQNGKLEIAVVGDTDLYVFNSLGQLMSGWPQPTTETTTLKAQITIGDIDGNRQEDILIGDGGMLHLYRDADFSRNAGVHAFNFNGSPIDLNPSSQHTALYGEYVSPREIVITDLDQNGKTDLVTLSHSISFTPNSDFTDIDQPATVFNRHVLVYAWDLNTPFEEEINSWPQAQRDDGQSGRHRIFNEPPVVSAGDDVEEDFTSSRQFDLRGAVTDDGRPNDLSLDFTWEQVSGPLSQLIDPKDINTGVIIDQPGVYRYRLIGDDGEKRTIDTIRISLTEAPPIVFQDTGILQNKFNPAKGEEGQLGINVPSESQVTITLYDRFGKEVRILTDEVYTGGTHIIPWNGRNEDGFLAASGFYHVVINIGGHIEKTKLIISK